MCCVARGCSSGQGRAGPAPVGLVSTGIKTPPRAPREGRIDKQQAGGRSGGRGGQAERIPRTRALRLG